jgi:Putative peptidoglycan binding domain/Glycosyl hydrolases family 25
VTIFYPDISNYQAGISLHGTVACCAKATESTSYLSTDFRPAQGRASQAGAYFFAYHFLHAGNGSGQANWCHAHVGNIPLMLDWEAAGSSHPGVGDATSFIDAYRRLGGICNLMYLPHWYWQQIGSPSLSPLSQRGMSLVSSAYTAYSDTGTGWQPYGGLTPKIWQYTDHFLFNGQRVDFNAFKGTVDQLKQLAGKGAVAPSGDPTISEGASGPPVTKMQNRLNTWGANPKLVADGAFGPASTAALKAFQGQQHLTVDGICGPSSWNLLNTDPHKVVPVTPPGQWKNPNEWTWKDAQLAGHGLDGKLHNFSYNSTTGSWDRHA